MRNKCGQKIFPIAWNKTALNDEMKSRRANILLITLFLTISIPAKCNDIYAEADRPGMGTGANVLPMGFIQWETGFEVAHIMGTHDLTLPTTLFRFGLGPWAELRLEYTGLLVTEDRPEENPLRNISYISEPLWIGSKIRLWKGSEDSRLKWIPRTSLLLDVGLPLTRYDAQYHPVSGTIDLLFENDLTDWFTIGYDVGIYWIDWTPTPDIFASLAFNFTTTDKLGVFIESYNNFDPDAFEISDPKKTYTLCNINLDFGLTYMVHPRVQLDLYSGFKLYHSENFLSGPRNNVYLGMGVTWLLYTHKKRN